MTYLLVGIYHVIHKPIHKVDFDFKSIRVLNDTKHFTTCKYKSNHIFTNYEINQVFNALFSINKSLIVVFIYV